MTDKGYEEMQRLVVLLLGKLGGDVTFTEGELAEADLAGKAIEIGELNPGSGGVRVRVVDAPSEA